MIKLCAFSVFFCLFLSVTVDGQVLSNVRVIDHREYMMEVISETVKEVERREWCNLKLPDFTQEFNEPVIHWLLNGSVTYSNGFVSSIGQVDVLQSSLNQIWTLLTDGSVQVQVEIRGQLRMTDLALGYDVMVNKDDSMQHFTGIMTHPLVVYDFSIFRNAHTLGMRVVVAGVQPGTSDTQLIDILPKNEMAHAITAMFDRTNTYAGVMSWGAEVFQPIAAEVITKVSFPGLCYDCPVS